MMRFVASRFFARGLVARWMAVGIGLIAASIAAAAEPEPEPEPADALATALAAALQLVHDQYAPSARPVPADVSERLAAEYGSELARARYVVSELAVQLLTAIDRFQGTSLRDDHHAVTVDDLIVFGSEPSSSGLGLWIWAHELHHVRQYRERGGLYEFALWYLRDCPAVERAADERANRALGESVKLRHCLG